DPIQALRRISINHDAPVEMGDGGNLRAVQVQRLFLEKAEAFKGSAGAAVIPDYEKILSLWADVLDGLGGLRLSRNFDIEDDPGDLVRKLDWVLKLWLVNRYRKARDDAWDHPLLPVLDLQYHRVDNLEGIFYKLQRDGMTARICDDDEIRRYIDRAPEDTRAYFRSRCIQEYAREIFLINWEVIGFDHGEVHRMVPLLNPLKGPREQFEDLFAHAGDSSALIAALEDAPSR
ncbi:MAG: proteasome accessory factor PafA2 family protein, partial [Desulfobacteraceae bacterium]